MSEKRFYHDFGSETTFKKYMKVIGNLLKNLYNKRSLHEKQKNLLREDKNIRFLIMKILEKYGIYEIKANMKFQFSET